MIGIMPQEKIRERVLGIASGEITPVPQEPKIWFPSIRTLGDVLSDENRALLHTIEDMRPSSVTELAHFIHQDVGIPERALEVLKGYGIVELEHEGNQVKPIAKATEFLIIC